MRPSTTATLALSVPGLPDGAQRVLAEHADVGELLDDDGAKVALTGAVAAGLLAGLKADAAVRVVRRLSPAALPACLDGETRRTVRRTLVLHPHLPVDQAVALAVAEGYETDLAERLARAGRLWCHPELVASAVRRGARFDALHLALDTSDREEDRQRWAALPLTDRVAIAVVAAERLGAATAQRSAAIRTVRWCLSDHDAAEQLADVLTTTAGASVLYLDLDDHDVLFARLSPDEVLELIGVFQFDELRRRAVARGAVTAAEAAEAVARTLRSSRDLDRLDRDLTTALAPDVPLPHTLIAPVDRRDTLEALQAATHPVLRAAAVASGAGLSLLDGAPAAVVAEALRFRSAAEIAAAVADPTVGDALADVLEERVLFGPLGDDDAGWRSLCAWLADRGGAGWARWLNPDTLRDAPADVLEPLAAGIPTVGGGRERLAGQLRTAALRCAVRLSDTATLAVLAAVPSLSDLAGPWVAGTLPELAAPTPDLLAALAERRPGHARDLAAAASGAGRHDLAAALAGAWTVAEIAGASTRAALFASVCAAAGLDETGWRTAFSLLDGWTATLAELAVAAGELSEASR